MKKNFVIFAVFAIFAFLFVSCADGIKGSLNDVTSGISSTNSSSDSNDDSSNNGSGNSSTSTYSSVSGGTFKNTTASVTWTITFNSDKSLSGSISNTSLSSYNWKESGKTITVYLDLGTSQTTIYTFTANSTYTTLTYNPSGSNYGSIVLKRQ